MIDISVCALGTTAVVAWLDWEGQLRLESKMLPLKEGQVQAWLRRPSNSAQRGWHDLLGCLPDDGDLDGWEACVAGMERILGQLHERLLLPVLSDVQSYGIVDLIVSLGGPLAALPLAAAWRFDEQGRARYLLEDYRTIAVVPALSFLQQVRPPAPLRRALLASTEDTLPEDVPAHLQRIGAALRPRGVHITMLGDNCSPGDALTPERLLREMPRADLIYLLGHGEFAPSDLAASGLRLPHGQMLSAESLIHSPSRLPSSVVLLAACRSGQTPAWDLGGEWLGLSGALLRAGASCVVAGLWDINYFASAPMIESICAQRGRRPRSRWRRPYAARWSRGGGARMESRIMSSWRAATKHRRCASAGCSAHRSSGPAFRSS